MKTYRLVALVLVSIVIAVLLATALASFTRVSDSALAEVATPGAGAGAGSSRPSVATKNYLPIIFLNSATAGGAWLLAGNSGTNWLTDFLGTTDNMTLTIRVSNTIALRIAPAVDPVYGYTQNIIGGSASNAVLPGANGATIAGGGLAGYANVISPTGSYGFIGGGDTNAISGWESVIAGGYGNVAGGLFSVIGGGEQNVITSSHGTIAGGGLNKATGSYYSTIGGGYGNVASGQDATIAGGSGNTAAAFRSAIGGGNANQIGISGTNAFIGGGVFNTVNREYAAIGGGAVNSVNREFAIISGGGFNASNSPYSVIGGGWANQITATATMATIGGGDHNNAVGDHATIAGGTLNTASGLYYSTIGGGYGNLASGQDATIAGGSGNIGAAFRAAIGGGNGNTIAVTGTNAFIGGGTFNTANAAYATIAGGYFNTVSGPYAMIPGGYANIAVTNTFAAGTGAEALHPGAFVWADSTGPTLASTRNDQFLVRASGGITLYTNSVGSVGASLYPGSGSWNTLSNKNLKTNFAGVDSRAILERVSELPITTWSYTTQDASIRHIGPMAQDFAAAFNVGENDTTISTVDAQGVALAAIQGLAKENKELKAKNEQELKELTERNEKELKELGELKDEVAALKAQSGAANGLTMGNLAPWAVVGLVAMWALRRGRKGGDSSLRSE